MSGGFHDADMKESFTGAVGQFDESESLLAIEPFNFGLPFRSGWYRPGLLSRRTVERPGRRTSKRRRGFWRLVGITAPTITEVFASAHLRSV